MRPGQSMEKAGGIKIVPIAVGALLLAGIGSAYAYLTGAFGNEEKVATNPLTGDTYHVDGKSKLYDLNYDFVPDGIPGNIDTSELSVTENKDPELIPKLKTMESAVEAIKKRDYGSFSKLLTPKYREDMGDRLKVNVIEMDIQYIGISVGDTVNIGSYDTRDNSFIVDGKPFDLEKVGNEWLISRISFY